jgi:hypothetical protein
MSDSFLGNRRKALEDCFFHQVDQKLLARLKAAVTGTQELRARLIEVTAIDDDAFIDKLVELGIQPETAVALSLVPLVQVAWADGQIQEGERKAILSAAKDSGIDEASPSYELLQGWLASDPNNELEATWRGYVQALMETLSPHERSKFCEAALKRARAVAAVTGGVLGLGDKTSASEMRVLDRLATAFEKSG